MTQVVPRDEATRLLQAAYEHWVAGPVWSIEATADDGTWVCGAVRPGLEWVDLRATGAVLVRDGVAHVRDVTMVLPLVGHGGDLAELHAVLAGRWVTCPAAAWRRRSDAGAVGMFAEELLDEPDEVVTPYRAERDGGEVVLWLTSSPGDRLVLVEDAEGVRLSHAPGPPLARRWLFDDVPLDLPDVAADGLVPVEDLLLELGRRPGKPKARSRTATVEVMEPEEPDEQWGLHSDDLAEALGVEAGYEAEALALQLLAERAPHLVHLVEGDSYDTVFSAYVPDRETAEAVAAVLRTPNP